MPRRPRGRCTTRRASVSGYPTIWKKPTRRADRAARIGLAAMAVLAVACRRPPAAHEAPGDRPRRVVALAPNLTEIVFALGAGDRLVGVSEYSDYPEAARTIPRVGGLEVDAEKVAALKRDLVLAIA